MCDKVGRVIVKHWCLAYVAVGMLLTAGATGISLKECPAKYGHEPIDGWNLLGVALAWPIELGAAIYAGDALRNLPPRACS